MAVLALTTITLYKVCRKEMEYEVRISMAVKDLYYILFLLLESVGTGIGR